MMMMTQNKMVSSVTDHHEMAPNARAQTHGECSAVNLRCRITLWPFLDLFVHLKILLAYLIFFNIKEQICS